jgi:hypothetical protein
MFDINKVKAYCFSVIGFLGFIKSLLEATSFFMNNKNFDKKLFVPNGKGFFDFYVLTFSQKSYCLVKKKDIYLFNNKYLESLFPFLIYDSIFYKLFIGYWAFCNYRLVSFLYSFRYIGLFLVLIFKNTFFLKVKNGIWQQ